MGKGDIKTKKGKINKGSYGNLIPHKVGSTFVAAPKKEKPAAKKPAAKKAAPKKTAAKKPAAKKTTKKSED